MNFNKKNTLTAGKIILIIILLQLIFAAPAFAISEWEFIRSSSAAAWLLDDFEKSMWYNTTFDDDDWWIDIFNDSGTKTKFW